MSTALSRSARGDINHLPCVFATALQQRCAVCSLALHEAEKLLCTQPLARAACASLQGQMRDKSRFALGLRSDPLSSPTSNADDLRLQCGGLQGLRSVLDPDALAIDVQRLLERLHADKSENLTWEPILRAIGQWQPSR